MSRLLKQLEVFCFSRRVPILAVLLLITIIMAYFAVQLKMEAGFEKQMPQGHEYINTFKEYRDDAIGANRINVVVRAKHGNIWTKQGLARLYDVTQAVMFLPNISRLGVQSLWTPNSFVNEITEDGFRADPVIGGTITPGSLTREIIASIQRSTTQGGYIGTLVSRDQTSAMITAELNEFDLDGKKIDYVSYNHILEEKLRKPFENSDFEIQIIGFAKQIGDISDGAKNVLVFCAIALLLTALAVYWYSHSIRFTLLPVFCSLTSLVWQFGTLRILGFGLDPLAVLVPFLVFAIGVSHGVQQINFIVRELAYGKTAEEAAKASFAGLLVPGTLALVTAFVSFISLILIPIPMVRELAITASIGVGFKIITNLVMLPIAASLMNFSKVYADKAMLKREIRTRWLTGLARLAMPKRAAAVLAIALIVFGLSVWQSRERVVGTLEPGAPELRKEARFNQDALSIAQNYDTGLDWLTVIFETKESNACEDVNIGVYQDEFVSHMQQVAGVLSINSFSSQIRTYNEGYNEGNPKMNVVPTDAANYSALAVEIGRIRGFMRKDCSMLAVNLFLTDHKASTINRVIDAVKVFRDNNTLPNVKIRLAAGNAGVLAAVNDEVEKRELPMMLNVYAAIIILVFVVYRDFRAVIACCFPLTIGTFIGYWFMKEFEIGLTVATLPVMVLAVGIGVDYAFYIYNRLQFHVVKGQPIVKAIEHAIMEVGMATIFTAVTLAIGVVTWSFSQLKFQADMGKLLAFMFMVNLVMAMTVLPALVVWMHKLFPRRKPLQTSTMFDH